MAGPDTGNDAAGAGRAASAGATIGAVVGAIAVAAVVAVAAVTATAAVAGTDANECGVALTLATVVTPALARSSSFLSSVASIIFASFDIGTMKIAGCVSLPLRSLNGPLVARR